MRKNISALVDMGHVYEIERSRWLCKATLAPKSHQEDVHDMSKFKWRFCVIYVWLNWVTRVWAFPVPRCNDASMYEFGDGRIDWFFDYLMGYHQIEVNERSRPKLAFAGPDAGLYTFGVIPFGVVNGPEIFIWTAHDINRDWQERAITKGVTIDRDTNTRLIVDDTVEPRLVGRSVIRTPRQSGHGFSGTQPRESNGKIEEKDQK